VLRRIHDDHVLEDGELMAVLVDEFTDVVTLGCERQGRERSADGIDGGERFEVFECCLDFLVAGHRDHPVVRFAHHRSLAAQVLPVGVGILGDHGVGEVVDVR
jgi:hypothetical protein